MKKIRLRNLLLSTALVTTICHADELQKFTATCTNGYFPVKLVAIPSSNQIKALIIPKGSGLDYSKPDPIQVYTSTSLAVTSDSIVFMGVSQDERKQKFELERKTGVLRKTYYGSTTNTLVMNCEKGDDYTSALNEIIDYENKIKISIAKENNKRVEEEKIRNNRPNKF